MNAEAWHGTSYGYTGYRCRCAQCREAHTQACRISREAKRRRFARGLVQAEHGLAATYVGCGCRCDSCTDAYRISRRQYRARLRERAEQARRDQVLREAVAEQREWLRFQGYDTDCVCDACSACLASEYINLIDPDYEPL